jgi:hypothetical protein
MRQTVVIRADDIRAGETEHVRVVHAGLEGEKEYDLLVSGRGLWLRFVGKRRLDIAPGRSRVRLVEVDG